MTYSSERVHLTAANLKQLAHGGAISINKKYHHGDHEVWLTKSQHHKFMKCREQGTPFLLHMKPGQFKHHLKHGSGIWDSARKLVQKLAPVIKPIAGKLIRAGAEKVGEHIKKKGESFIDSLIEKATPYLGDQTSHLLGSIAKSGLKKGTEKAKSKLHEKLHEHGAGLHIGKGKGLHTIGKGLHTIGKGAKISKMIEQPHGTIGMIHEQPRTPNKITVQPTTGVPKELKHIFTQPGSKLIPYSKKTNVIDHLKEGGKVKKRRTVHRKSKVIGKGLDIPALTKLGRKAIRPAP